MIEVENLTKTYGNFTAVDHKLERSNWIKELTLKDKIMAVVNLIQIIASPMRSAPTTALRPARTALDISLPGQRAKNCRSFVLHWRPSTKLLPA